MADAFVNPLDDSNFVQGGGLWEGKTVTITNSTTEVDRLTFKDGSPVINEKSGLQAIRNVWKITGIAEDEDRERQETYSLGSLVPSADGESFAKADGTPGVLHSSSEAAKFSAGLKSGGYDMASLFDTSTGKVVVSRLIGARLTFAGVQKLDINGDPKINKKGYAENKFYPVAYVGQAAGVGRAAAVDPAIKTFASELVVKVLEGKGGSLSRADLISGLSKELKGDARIAGVLSLVSTPGFYAGAAFVQDGTSIRLGA